MAIISKVIGTVIFAPVFVGAWDTQLAMFQGIYSGGKTISDLKTKITAEIKKRWTTDGKVQAIFKACKEVKLGFPDVKNFPFVVDFPDVDSKIKAVIYNTLKKDSKRLKADQIIADLKATAQDLQTTLWVHGNFNKDQKKKAAKKACEDELGFKFTKQQANHFMTEWERTRNENEIADEKRTRIAQEIKIKKQKQMEDRSRRIKQVRKTQERLRKEYEQRVVEWVNVCAKFAWNWHYAMKKCAGDENLNVNAKSFVDFFKKKWNQAREIERNKQVLLEYEHKDKVTQVTTVVKEALKKNCRRGKVLPKRFMHVIRAVARGGSNNDIKNEKAVYDRNVVDMFDFLSPSYGEIESWFDFVSPSYGEIESKRGSLEEGICPKLQPIFQLLKKDHSRHNRNEEKLKQQAEPIVRELMKLWLRK